MSYNRSNYQRTNNNNYYNKSRKISQNRNPNYNNQQRNDSQSPHRNKYCYSDCQHKYSSNTPKQQRQINQVQKTEETTSDPLVSMIQKVQNYN